MGKECGTWVSRCLWGGANMSPLKTTVWGAKCCFVKAAGFLQTECLCLIQF